MVSLRQGLLASIEYGPGCFVPLLAKLEDTQQIACLLDESGYLRLRRQRLHLAHDPLDL